MKKVILIIGNRYQPNVCGFILEFEKLNGKIDGILCLIPKHDLKFYLKRSIKILKFLKPSTLKSSIINSICALSKKQKLRTLKESWNVNSENSWNLLENKFDIFNFAKEHKIPLNFSPFLSPEIINSYTKNGPVIFPLYVGGILSNEILNNPNAEFVNAHMGEMPQYRGMNVIEWAILENIKPKVAVMTMNEKIDGGDVIYHKDIILNNEKTIAELRRTGYVFCYKAMAEGISKYRENANLRQKQPKGAKYYYRMHGKIKKLVEHKLSQI